MSQRGNLTIIFVFNCLYLIGAALTATGHSNSEFMIYIGVVALAVIAIGLVHWKLNFHPALLWLLSFWGLMHMCGGLLTIPESWPRGAEKPVLYNLWLIKDTIKFDNFVHAYGFGVTTWLLWQINRRLQIVGLERPSLKPLCILGLCLLGSMGLGAFNEIIEFVATLLIPETNVGGYVNTGWDLVSNMVGATVVALCIYVFDIKKG